MSAADHRLFMARKLWNNVFMGWSTPHWELTKKDKAALAYWDRNGHIERDGELMRLTELGRAELTASKPG